MAEWDTSPAVTFIRLILLRTLIDLSSPLHLRPIPSVISQTHTADSHVLTHTHTHIQYICIDRHKRPSFPLISHIQSHTNTGRRPVSGSTRKFSLQHKQIAIQAKMFALEGSDGLSTKAVKAARRNALARCVAVI